MEPGNLEYCLWAVVKRDENGEIKCPLIDCMGCEACYEAWENSLKYEGKE